MAPKKIAILGGGMASLAAAFELTSRPGWRDEMEVTVYQMGHRLGGKCASSRVPTTGDGRGSRIEEHGLHVWFGFYQNAFRLIRRCYAELGSTAYTVPGMFRRRSSTPLMEKDDLGRWTVWPIDYPEDPEGIEPGLSERDEAPSVLAYVGRLRRFAGAQIEWLEGPGGLGEAAGRILRLASWFIPDAIEERVKELAGVVGSAAWRALWEVARRRTSTRRAWLVADLAIAGARGLMASRATIESDGLAALDREDLRAWLRRHGASEQAISSAPVRALYDLVFAYEDGDSTSFEKANFAAGTAILTALRISMGYRGAVCYTMGAGMGEVVIGPLYEVLTRRGVRFELLHRVDRLEVDPREPWVKRIHMTKQAALARDPRTGRERAYDPLLPMGADGLICWRDAVDRAQLKEGAALPAGTDFESAWCAPWRHERRIALERGRDFDVIVLGIPIGALGPITRDLMAIPRWRRMIEGLKTVETQSAQLWLDRSLAELGWVGRPPSMIAAPERMDVWSDMSDVLARESWPEGAPRSVQYICGPMPGDYAARCSGDPTAPERAREQVRAETDAWQDHMARSVWPGARAPDGAFDPARLVARHLQANVSPSDRYTLSLAGTTELRLRPGEAPLDGLVLAGDWTRTGLEAGCVESAVTSGILAARAVREEADESVPGTTLRVGAPREAVEAVHEEARRFAGHGRRQARAASEAARASPGAR